MKKILAIAIALYASTAFANILNSKHDIGVYTNGGGASVCYYCHVPHNSLNYGTDVPLWAKNNLGTAYTVYSGTLFGGPAVISNMTRACLSCHDGTTDMAQTIAGDLNGASDVRAGTAVTPAGGPNPTANPRANISTDLQNDHPVGVTWVSNATNGLAAAAPATFPLFSSRLECASCHEPHSNVVPSVASGLTKRFMRDPSADFCAACHTTK